MSLSELGPYQKKLDQSDGNYEKLCALAKELVDYFDTQEKVMEISREKFALAPVLETAKGVVRKIKNLSHGNLPAFLSKLKLRMASLRYRAEVLTPLVVSEEGLKVNLVSALIKWKEHLNLFLEKKATETDLKKIEQLSRYPKFTKHLLRDKEMLNECFKLVFRDNFPVRQLVEYLKTCAIDLRKVFIAPRVGFFHKYGTDVLTITEELSREGKVKDLRLLVNGCFVSILEDKAIIECGAETLTWKEIKQKWAQSSQDPAQFEFFQEKGMLMCFPQGIVYSREKVDTTQARWWENPILPVFLTLTREQLEKRFLLKRLGIELSDEKPCLAAVEASCMDPESVDDAHGSYTIYMPIEKGAKYRVYPLGKYAKVFPTALGEKVSFLCDSVQAVPTYPDPTPFYTQRLHGEAPVALTMEEAESVLQMFGKETWYFQVTGDNCASTPQTIFEKVIGKKEDGGLADNYFKESIANVKHTAPGTAFFTLIGQLPDMLARPIFHGLHILLGSKREIKRTDDQGNVIATRSLYTHDFCKTQNIYVPGILIKRILCGEIKGITWYGYD